MNINKLGRTPIYMQIIDEIEKEILAGIIKPMDQLPSVRALSMEISINPNTIQKAYTELEHKGICYTSPGQGRFVAADAADKIKSGKLGIIAQVNQLVTELLSAGMSLEEIIEAVRAEHLKKEIDEK